MIAIDSSGLKCYGQDEWVREKYGKISEKRNWRKIHVRNVKHFHGFYKKQHNGPQPWPKQMTI